MTAQEVRKFRNLTSKLIKIEERSKLFRKLQSKGIGLKEEEEFVRREQAKLKGEVHTTGKKKKETVWIVKQKDGDGFERV